MVHIEDMAVGLSRKELDRLMSSADYRAMKEKDAGIYKWHQRRFLRPLLGAKWKWRCAYCKVRIAQESVIDVLHEYFPRLEIRKSSDEHVTPQSEGGSYSANNIVLACKECNNKRGNTPIDQFLTNLGWDEVAISEWHETRRFDSQTAMTINKSLIEIEQWKFRSKSHNVNRRGGSPQ